MQDRRRNKEPVFESGDGGSDSNRIVGVIIGGIIGAIWLIITLVGGIVITPAGHVNVLLRFGKVEGVLVEGFSVKMPLIDGVEKMSVQTQLFEVKDATAASRDLQDVKTSIAINYKLDPSYAGDVYRTLGVGYIERIAQPAVQEILKSITARYDAQDLIVKRESVKEDIAEELTKRLNERHILTEVVNITNFQFSTEFTAAIESKQVAVQKVQEAENQLRRIEVEARQAEQKAKGDAAAAVARANGQAEAAAILSQAIKDNPAYLQYMYIDKLASNASIIVVPEGMPLTIPSFK